MVAASQSRHQRIIELSNEFTEIKKEADFHHQQSQKIREQIQKIATEFRKAKEELQKKRAIFNTLRKERKKRSLERKRQYQQEIAKEKMKEIEERLKKGKSLSLDEMRLLMLQKKENPFLNEKKPEENGENKE